MFCTLSDLKTGNKFNAALHQSGADMRDLRDGFAELFCLRQIQISQLIISCLCMVNCYPNIADSRVASRFVATCNASGVSRDPVRRRAAPSNSPRQKMMIRS